MSLYEWVYYYMSKNHPDSTYIYCDTQPYGIAGVDWWQHKLCPLIYRRTRGKMDCEGAD